MKWNLLSVVLLALPAVAAAQTPRIAPRASVVFAQGAPEVLPDTMNLAETHWKEGALFGGIGLGLFGAHYGDEMCGSPGCLIGGFLIGGIVGGVTGAMIGGLFPKTAP